jgi:DNA-binding transcriptional LysR family regulator
MDLNLLQLFVTVAQTSSFSGAARRLGLPKSSVSRKIAALEAVVGAQLLHRTTRQVALSTAGAALYERAAPLVASLRDAVGSLPEREQQPSGELRITAPYDLGATFLAELVAQFALRYPTVRADVWLTNRKVDLVAEGFDVAVRAQAGPIKDSSLTMRRLSTVEMQLFAAPGYLARRGTPRSEAEAAAHDLVSFRALRGSDGLGARNRIVCDDFLFLREAVRAGAGLGLMPTFLAAADVAAGELVRVLPRYSQRGGTFVLLYPATRHVPRKVTAFRDFLLESLTVRPLAPRAA